MNVGKKFENNFKNSVPKNVYFFRIKDSATSFAQDSSAVRFSPKNPYDQFLFFERNLLPMELKSTSGTSISIQLSKEDKSKMIKLHQIEGLQYADSFDGIFAGFVFDFRTSNKTYYMSISKFTKFLNDTSKKSINEKDIVLFGGFIIDKHLKRTNYEYHIIDLINKIIA